MDHEASTIVDADRIVAMVPTEEVDRGWPGGERVEGRGKAVFSGRVNCHTYLRLTMAPGIQEDFRFPSTLRFPTSAQAMLNAEENAVFASLGALESLRGENTTMLEIGMRLPDYAKLCRRLLGWPAPESGTFCHGDGAHGGGDRPR